MSRNVLDALKGKFGARLREIEVHSPQRIYVTVHKDDLVEVAGFVFRDLDARFVTSSGVDNLDSFEVLHHFSFDKQDIMLSLRVLLDREKPEVPSITPVVKGAAWIEREIYELFGFRFLNHPELKRFLLPEDWPDGVYPLRKERATTPPTFHPPPPVGRSEEGGEAGTKGQKGNGQ